MPASIDYARLTPAENLDLIRWQAEIELGAAAGADVTSLRLHPEQLRVLVDHLKSIAPEPMTSAAQEVFWASGKAGALMAAMREFAVAR